MTSILFPIPVADNKTRNGLISGLAAALATILGLLLLLCCCLRRNRNSKDEEPLARKEDPEDAPVVTTTQMLEPVRQPTMDPIPEQSVEESVPMVVQRSVSEPPPHEMRPSTPRGLSIGKDERSSSSSPSPPKSRKSSIFPDVLTSRKPSVVPESPAVREPSVGSGQGRDVSSVLQEVQNGVKVEERVPTPPVRVATLPLPGRVATVPVPVRAAEV